MPAGRMTARSKPKDNEPDMGGCLGQGAVFPSRVAVDNRFPADCWIERDEYSAEDDLAGRKKKAARRRSGAPLFWVRLEWA